MTVLTEIERLKPSTISGEGVRISYTYTSFDKAEIDRLEEDAKSSLGYVTILEVKADADSD